MTHAVGPTSLQRTSAGWLLQINGITEEAHLGAYIWPGGVPAGVHIEAGLVITEPHPSGDFTLTGITMEALQAMDPWWSSYFSQNSVMTADEPEQHGQHPASEGGHMPGAEQGHRAEEVHDWIENGTHGALTIAEIAGRFAEEGTKFALAGEILGGFGDVLAVATVLYATWHAFGERLRDEENRGAMYGLIWQVMGRGDIEPQYDDTPVYGDINPWDTKEEMAQAFHEGVAKGRGMGGDVHTHNRVAAAIAWQMVQNGLDEDVAASMVLYEIWTSATGGTKHQMIDYP